MDLQAHDSKFAGIFGGGGGGGHDDIFEFKLSDGTDLDLSSQAEYSGEPRERIIYKMCVIKMLLHECYESLSEYSSIECKTKKYEKFDDVYLDIVVPFIHKNIFVRIESDYEFRNQGIKHISKKPNDVDSFNKQMGHLIRDLQHFILAHEKEVKHILSVVDDLELQVIDIYNTVFTECFNGALESMDPTETSVNHKLIQNILFTSKKVLYYFSQLFLISTKKTHCEQHETFNKYITLLQKIDSSITNQHIGTINEFVKFNIIHFNKTYNDVNKLVVTQDFVSEFMHIYSQLTNSGLKLLECLVKVNGFSYDSPPTESDDRTDLLEFKEKLEELSEQIYTNYDVLVRQLSK